MPSSHLLLAGGYPDIGYREELWDPGQEWIQIFDNLLKHPQGVKRGCSCDICSLAKSSISPACPLSPRLSLPTDLSKTSWRRSKGDDNSPGMFQSTVEQCYPLVDSGNPRSRGGSVDRMCGDNSKRKKSGTVDEESFIQQFCAPGSILVLSVRELDLQLARVYTSLTSKDWLRRVEALQLMRALVTGGAGQVEEFPGRLRYLKLPFECCVKDLRSQVVRECCVTVAYLAQELQYKAQDFLQHLLPALINLIQHGAKVVSSSGIVCIRFLLQNTYCSKFLPIICSSVSSKSRTTRSNIFQFLEQLLHVWPVHTLDGHQGAVQEALRVGLGDADPDTRSWARKAFWAFADHFRLEADSFLSSMDQENKELFAENLPGSSPYCGMSGGRSRQSSVDRSQDSLDGSQISSDYQFDRGGRRASSRVKRGYGSLDQGRSCPIVLPLQRSNSAVDATAARRALVRQQYSESSRSKVQRAGSIRRGSGQSSSQEGINRRPSGEGRRSQPASRATSPAPTRSYQTFRDENSIHSKAISTVKRDEKKVQLKKTTSALQLLRSNLQTKTQEWKISTNAGQEQKTQTDNHTNEMVSPQRKSSTVEEWIKSQNQYLTKAENHDDDDDEVEDAQAVTKFVNLTNHESMLKNTNSPSNQLWSMLEILGEAMDKNDTKKQLEILECVDKILADNTTISSAPDLAESLLSQLIRLIRSDEKQVSKAAEENATKSALSLPCSLSIPLLCNRVKKEQFPDLLTVIKLLEKVLEVQKADQVKIYLKEIMLGLLKSYDNNESSVRKASVNCIVTLHGLVGESALQPHLDCLSGPKRKLLSLYIMRHRQRTVCDK